jgi:hypothetical protein
MQLAKARSTQHLVLCPALAPRGVKGAVQGRSEAQGREPARASNGRRERAQRPLMDLGAFQNPSRQRAGMFHPLPSASRRGVKAFLAAFWLPVARGGQRQSNFACAKLSHVNSAQSVTASSGDTSQCGVCFCDGGQLATGRKGRCASALAPGVQPTPCIARIPSSHWNGSPPGTGVP